MGSDIRAVSEGSILFAEEEIKLWLWPRCLWRQSRGSMKLGARLSLSSSAVSAAEKARWINAYLHSTKPEESEFPSARGCEGSAGK